MPPKHNDMPIKSAAANKQQESVKKIMAERRVPFEQAVDIYIAEQKK